MTDTDFFVQAVHYGILALVFLGCAADVILWVRRSRRRGAWRQMDTQV